MGHRRGLLDGPPPTEHRPARAPDFPRTAPPTGDPMRRRLTGGNTDADEDMINLPWFLTASRGRGGLILLDDVVAVVGILLLLLDLGFVHP
jgi:hypothetical protein